MQYGYEENLSHETNFTLDPPNDDPNRKPIQYEEILGEDRGFLLYNLLSELECSYYINESEKLGLQDLTYQKRYRNNSRCIVLSPQICDSIWQRLKDYIMPINLEPDDYKQTGKGYRLEGTWIPVGLNPCWRICKYVPGGHFGPHFDGPYVRNLDERSLKTLNIYLNGGFEGGTTNFVKESQSLHPDENGHFCAEEQNILHRVVPAAGMALVFNHHILHEGEELKSDVKYLMRSDVMFRRQKSPEIDPKERSALEIMAQAQQSEIDGKYREATELYRRAFKLWPPLEFNV